MRCVLHAQHYGRHAVLMVGRAHMALCRIHVVDKADKCRLHGQHPDIKTLPRRKRLTGMLPGRCACTVAMKDERCFTWTFLSTCCS